MNQYFAGSICEGWACSGLWLALILPYVLLLFIVGAAIFLVYKFFKAGTKKDKTQVKGMAHRLLTAILIGAGIVAFMYLFVAVLTLIFAN